MTDQIRLTPMFGDRTAASPPSRLHHAAYVSSDQERTRQFYEDVLGIPLIAFWIERVEAFGELHEFSHAFYGLKDGSALAFFNFADADQQARYLASKQSFFIHLALNVTLPQQQVLRTRLREAGVEVQEMNHGFCNSLYVSDPDGQLIELAADLEDWSRPTASARREARQLLGRWISGDRTPTNDLRER